MPDQNGGDSFANRVNRSRQALIGLLKAEFENFDLAHAAGATIQAKLEAAKAAVAAFLKQKYQDIKDFKQKHPVRFWIIVGLIVLALISGPMAAGILSGVGFTAGGVAGGSLAAGLHSSIGLVASGSLFAFCQSIAATGAIFGIGYGILVPTCLLTAWCVKRYGNTDDGSMELVPHNGGPPKGPPPKGPGSGAVLRDNLLEGANNFGNTMASGAKACGRVIETGATIATIGGMVAANYAMHKFYRWMGYKRL